MILPTSSTLKLDHLMWEHKEFRQGFYIFRSYFLEAEKLGVRFQAVIYQGEKQPRVMLCSAVSRTVGKWDAQTTFIDNLIFMGKRFLIFGNVELGGGVSGAHCTPLISYLGPVYL